MTNQQWKLTRARLFRLVNDFQKENDLPVNLMSLLLSDCLYCKSSENAIEEIRAARHAASEPPGRGGYINKHGIRVPNPCSEIDTKGRDMGRFYRNCKMSIHTDDYIDEVLNDPNNV